MAGYTGTYCTACDLKYANVNNMCLMNCIMHGGYNNDYTGCTECTLNFAEPFCTSCVDGY